MTQYGQENRKLQKEHKMADLSFQDVCKLLKDGKGDLTSLMENRKDIIEFANQIDEVGEQGFLRTRKMITSLIC